MVKGARCCAPTSASSWPLHAPSAAALAPHPTLLHLIQHPHPRAPPSPARSYFLAPKPELVSELTGDVTASRDQLAELDKQRERAEGAIKAVEQEVAEVARDNPGAQAAFRRMMGGA